jgi:MtN3 and saliva related transmembrane protein
MLASSLPTLIGLVAGCLSSASLVPQVLKCWRERHTEAVSKRMFATRAFGLVLWSIYGFFAGSLPIVIFSSLNLALSTTILILTARNSSQELPGGEHDGAGVPSHDQ